jgi:signal transduction histidine kinase
MRKLSLHFWLAAALALAVAAPAAVGAGAWLVTGAWQSNREASRERRAIAAIRGTDPSAPDDVKRLMIRLSALRVEAEIMPLAVDAAVGDKAAMTKKPLLATAGFPGGDEPAGRTSKLDAGKLGAAIWVRPESSAPRWAIAIASGAVALIAALVVVVVFLRRWVLAPLARLAADAERIAGGELEVAPIPTRAREVAQVGEAMHGMAGALGAAVDASAAAERDRRFLVTAIAHDLRTPLFTLRGSLEALERGLGNGRYLGLAQERADHLDRLVSDLFAYSRLEYADEDAAWAEVDIAGLARDMAEALSGVHDVRVDAGGLEHAIVRGDPEALQRLLTNLLDNALRHGRARVGVSTARSNGTVTVEVVDDGPGFAEADLPHVFEPLFRGDRARGGSHAGLGLAIARRLARGHGGDVQAANAPDGGARLTVRLPAVR